MRLRLEDKCLFPAGEVNRSSPEKVTSHLSYEDTCLGDKTANNLPAQPRTERVDQSAKA